MLLTGVIPDYAWILISITSHLLSQTVTILCTQKITGIQKHRSTRIWCLRVKTAGVRCCNDPFRLPTSSCCTCTQTPCSSAPSSSSCGRCRDPTGKSPAHCIQHSENTISHYNRWDEVWDRIFERLKKVFLLLSTQTVLWSWAWN